MKRKDILFLICLAGGALFGGLFFAAFGAEVGYDWTLAGICAGGGLFFAVAFFVVWLIVEKHSKPVSFEDKKAQSILQEDEKNFAPYEARFHGRILYGERLKTAVCETYIYLLADKIHIAFSYFRKVQSVELAYGSFAVEVDDEDFFVFVWQDGRIEGRLMENNAESLRNLLKEKGAYVQGDDPFEQQ